MPCYISRRDQTLIMNVIKIGQRLAGALVRDMKTVTLHLVVLFPLPHFLLLCAGWHNSALEWHTQAWTGPCAMAQAPPSTNIGAPFEKKLNVLRAPADWKCCKVFCTLVVTLKTSVLTVTTKIIKKGRQLFCMRAPVTAADGTAPKTPPVRLRAYIV